MSVREDIALDIISDLQGITDPAVVLVSRNPIVTTDLAITQYPCIFVRTTSEAREDGTMNGTRLAEVDYTIIGYIRASSSATTINNTIDTDRNKLVAAIETALEVDRTRNSKALNSYVSSVTVDDGTIYPLGKVDITFTVTYKYTRGTL
tara:strand:- start:5 stop:451 length:447 start_codon:yes stop_codon:yes gene_type:complete